MSRRAPLAAAASVAALAACVGTALGQAAQRAAFVGNNGNAEGSVTSYTFSPRHP